VTVLSAPKFVILLSSWIFSRCHAKGRLRKIGVTVITAVVVAMTAPITPTDAKRDGKSHARTRARETHTRLRFALDWWRVLPPSPTIPPPRVVIRARMPFLSLFVHLAVSYSARVRAPTPGPLLRDPFRCVAPSKIFLSHFATFFFTLLWNHL